MRVQKKPSRKPRYPSHRHFFAALGVGAMASLSSAETPPPPPGIPPPPKPAVEEGRLLGDIAVVPTNLAPPKAASTNCPSVNAPSTNRLVRPSLKGVMKAEPSADTKKAAK